MGLYEYRIRHEYTNYILFILFLFMGGFLTQRDNDVYEADEQSC